MEIKKYEDVQQKFETICKSAEGLSLAQNAGAAFEAVVLVNSLREVLTDEIVKNVFMPLMNTKIGFLTDRDGKPDRNNKVKPVYGVDVVRDAIIDAASFGLLPAFNQINIIAGKMYPTKEGFTALLRKLKVKYVLNFGPDNSKPDAKFAEISVKINYKYNEEQNSFLMTAVVPKNAYSTYDQLKGKAERRAKKMLYEYITGLDLGENDEDSVYNSSNSRKVDDAEIIEQNENSQESKPKEETEKVNI